MSSCFSCFVRRQAGQNVESDRALLVGLVQAACGHWFKGRVRNLGCGLNQSMAKSFRRKKYSKLAETCGHEPCAYLVWFYQRQSRRPPDLLIVAVCFGGLCSHLLCPCSATQRRLSPTSDTAGPQSFRAQCKLVAKTRPQAQSAQQKSKF
jgi:hypothetical protein